MGTYKLYKNKKVINIIEAEEDFITLLKNSGQIDEGIDITLQDHSEGLEYNQENKCFIPVQENKLSVTNSQNIKIITMEDMQINIQDLDKKIIQFEKQTSSNIEELQSALFAIKGFMMLMPDIQNSLLKINDMLQKENNINTNKLPKKVKKV